MREINERDRIIHELETRVLKIKQELSKLKLSQNETNLFQQLQELWYQSQIEINNKWQRTLPFADYIVNRWEKARILGFGEGTSIYDSLLVLGEVKVGENTWIGLFTILDGLGGLEIGSFCSIAAGVQIYTHDTVEWSVTGGKTAPGKPTKIGDRCYIGFNTITVDVVADQLVIGWHGLFALEAMAMKKPVLCFIREDIEDLYISSGLYRRGRVTNY